MKKNMLKKFLKNFGKNNANVWGYCTLSMHIH